LLDTATLSGAQGNQRETGEEELDATAECIALATDQGYSWKKQSKLKLSTYFHALVFEQL